MNSMPVVVRPDLSNSTTRRLTMQDKVNQVIDFSNEEVDQAKIGEI